MDKNKFIAGKEAFYDDEKLLHYCYVGINDQHKSLQYLAYGSTPEKAIERAASLAYTLNSLAAKLEKMKEQN